MTEQSRLMQQVEEIRRRAKVCPACGGTAKIEGESVEEANNERGYVVIEGKWTCYKCNGSGQVEAPEIDALCDALVTLAQVVEAREERALAYIDRNANPQAYVDAVCRESEAYFKGLALLRDGLFYKTKDVTDGESQTANITTS